MADNFYPPLLVYKNLKNIFTYRTLELVDGDYNGKVKKPKTVSQTKNAKEKKETKSKEPVQAWMSDDAFMELIQWKRFCIIEARDAPTKDRRHPRCHPYAVGLKVKTFFIILDKDFDTNSADVAKMMGNLPSADKFNIDCIMISEDYLTIHAKKKMETYEASGSDKSGYVIITNQLHTLFMHDIFKRPTMPKYCIVPHAEEAAILQEILINKINIEKKSSKDPVMIILGALPGDFIEIICFNENTGNMIRYGVVR
jgi:DNA-directed RNA polymerase subunit H (RpoH/RPB5)